MSSIQYPSLLGADIEKFEEQFYAKRKHFEEFATLMNDRAELELNYGKSIEKCANQLGNLIEKGGLSGVITSLKSYHLMKAEQSKQLGNSLKEDVSSLMKAFIKTKATESKKVLSQAVKNDHQMKDLIEKLGTAKRGVIQTNQDIQNNLQSREIVETLPQNELNDEKKKQLLDKNSLLSKQLDDQTKKLKDCIDEYNTFKSNFNEECNKVVNFYKEFDILRMNHLRDAAMKYFVFEISEIRNLQYDVDKLIEKIENYDFSKDVEELSFYKPKTEPDAIEYESLKDHLLSKPAENTKLKGIVYENVQILPEDFGITNALKSFVDLFGGAKSLEAKKKEEEKNFLEKKWKAICSGTLITEADEEKFLNLLAQEYNRKLFIEFFSKIRIKTSEGFERRDPLKEQIKRILIRYLSESHNKKDLTSIKLYIHQYRNQTQDKDKDTCDKLYVNIDKEISSQTALQSEELWVSYMTENVNKRDEEELIRTINHSSKLLKNYVTDKENAYSILKSVGSLLLLNDEQISRIQKDYDEIKSQESSPSRKESFDDWLNDMEKRIADVQKAKKNEPVSIFSKRVVVINELESMRFSVYGTENK